MNILKGLPALVRRIAECIATDRVDLPQDLLAVLDATDSAAQAAALARPIGA